MWWHTLLVVRLSVLAGAHAPLTALFKAHRYIPKSKKLKYVQ